MLYRSTIKENLPNKLIPKYGQYLFGDERKLKEPNTEREKFLKNQIRDWLNGDFMNVSKTEFIDTLNELMALKKYEPEVLQPPSDILFRGIRTSLNKLLKKSNEEISKNDFTKMGNFYYTEKDAFTYIPTGEIQSWTISQKDALDFLEEIYPDSKSEFYYNIIVRSKFKQNEIIFNPKFLNLIFKDYGGTEQNEVLHIGNKPIKVQIILTKKDYNLAFPVWGDE